MLYIPPTNLPPTNLLLLAAKQEPYKKAYLLTKNIGRIFWKKFRRMDQQAEKDKTERVTGLGRRTRAEIVKWNQMTALRFQDRGETSDIPGLHLGGTWGTWCCTDFKISLSTSKQGDARVSSSYLIFKTHGQSAIQVIHCATSNHNSLIHYSRHMSLNVDRWFGENEAEWTWKAETRSTGRQRQDQQKGRNKINRKAETRSTVQQKQDQQGSRNKINRKALTRSTRRQKRKDQQEDRNKVNRMTKTRSTGRQKQDQQESRNKINRKAETRSIVKRKQD